MHKTEPSQIVKQQAKSKTNWLGLAVLLLGYAQMNLTQVAAYLGEHQGAINFVIGAAIIIIRQFTTKAISEK